MKDISIDEYSSFVKQKRNSWFMSPYELVYKAFSDMGYASKDKEFFIDNASEIVETLREKCWNTYVPIEKSFTSAMLRELIDEDIVNDMTPQEAITWFVEKYPDHIYSLTLSNTQSRRSRAGKEFEAIIELILIGAGIPMDSQGNIGKQVFVQKGLGKLVDVVSPGVVEFAIDKNDTVLISAKTTLRERWQEVPEEMGRTGAREMYLATLDTSISDEVLNTLYEANIRITTTKNIKDKFYPDNRRVLTFEQLVAIAKDYYSRWLNFEYDLNLRDQIIGNINIQIEKHSNHSFVADYYKKRLSLFGEAGE